MRVPLILALLLASAPVVPAHVPPGPVLACRPAPGGAYHDDVGQSVLPEWVPPRVEDGAADDCDGDDLPGGDGEPEHGVGLAVLAVDAAAQTCFGITPHHSGAIRALDVAGLGPAFWIISDHSRVAPPAGTPDCGDGLLQPSRVPCTCQWAFPWSLVVDLVNSTLYTVFGDMTIDPTTEVNANPNGPSGGMPWDPPGKGGVYHVLIVGGDPLAPAGHVWT